MRLHAPLVFAVSCWLAASTFAADPTDTFVIFPQTIELDGAEASRGVLVSKLDRFGRAQDLTRDAKYVSLNEACFVVDSSGEVTAISDGTGELEISVGSNMACVTVTVQNADVPIKRFFATDIVSILSRHGCNSSGCHGKAEGQNGFKLSVFGFAPRADFDALVREGRGRRISVAAPNHSLLLTKVSGEVPHGGGIRIKPGTRAYKIIQEWIASGATLDDRHPTIERIEVYPQERILEFGASQQMRVMATFDNGMQRDVTHLAKYRTNNDGLAEVDEDGLIRIGKAPGHVAVMASFLDQLDTAQVLIPNPINVEAPPLDQQASDHPIDRSVNRRLRQLNITESPPADDATFLRRVFLDVIGTLPTSAETRQFLDDDSPDKRPELVERLLERPEYATYWSLKWSDTLRVERQSLGHKNAYAYYKWIRDSIADNTPLDAFARSIVAARGTLRDEPAGTFFKAVTKSGERSSVLSQVFLGVRLECAQCHHHPFDRISQADYHGMRAFFEPVSLHSTSRGEMLKSEGKAVAKHPRSGEELTARPLYGGPIGDSVDAREQLAEWMTSSANPWFARNMANRIWAHFMGRGLVEPVDDFRATNPPSNPELMDDLADAIVNNDYDVKALIRLIVSSDAYQRSTTPNATNERDEQNYSRALFKRMDAEVLMDAVCQVTGLPEKFPGNPPGIRAIELWDSGSKHYFLNLFGRPLRKSVCQCERNIEPNISQVLHVLNSGEIQSKLQHPHGQIARMVRENADDESAVEEMYLSFYCRRPTQDEIKNAVEYFRSSHSRREASEDLAWSLLNSYEFLFNH